MSVAMDNSTKRWMARRKTGQLVKIIQGKTTGGGQSHASRTDAGATNPCAVSVLNPYKRDCVEQVFS
jgi:hypothetical protein